MAKKRESKKLGLWIEGTKVIVGSKRFEIIKTYGKPQTLLASDPFFTHFSSKFVKVKKKGGDGRWIV